MIRSNKMKRVFRTISMLALSAFMACGFAACGGGGGGGDEPEVDSAGNTIVKIMFHVDEKSTEGQAYKKRIDAFNTAYKDRKIKASASYQARTTGAASYETELLNKQVEGTLPDIITFDAPNCASYARSKLLYDISSLVPQEVQDDFLSLNKYDGKLYGLPIQESSAGFYYNKKIFARANIDVSGYTVETPWTFDQFKDVCRRLKNSVTTAVDMRLDATKDETATYLLYPFIYAAGGSFTSADGFTATGYLNSSATQSGFQFLRDLVNEGYTSYSGGSGFFTGEVGMYLSSGWTIPDLDNKYKETFADRNDWGLLPYPQGTAKASATGSWCYGITNNNHKDKSAATELLLWLTSTESSDAITDATGMIAARKSVDKNYAPGSPEEVLLKQLQLTGKARPATVAYPTFTTCFNQIIYKLQEKDSLSDILNSQTNTLQSEMDRLHR